MDTDNMESYLNVQNSLNHNIVSQNIPKFKLIKEIHKH